jgi:hypothetical protein
MPTVLVLSGWRFFFYSNESGEPIHIHCRKAEMECKFWIYPEEYEVEIAYEYNLGITSTSRRTRLLSWSLVRLESVHTI